MFAGRAKRGRDRKMPGIANWYGCVLPANAGTRLAGNMLNNAPGKSCQPAKRESRENERWSVVPLCGWRSDDFEPDLPITGKVARYFSDEISYLRLKVGPVPVASWK